MLASDLDLFGVNLLGIRISPGEGGRVEKGNDLYRLLIQLTGLEPDGVAEELDGVLSRLRLDPETLSFDDIRLVMAHYLEDCQREIQEKSRTQSPTLGPADA